MKYGNIFHQSLQNNRKAKTMLEFKSVENLDGNLYRNTLKKINFNTRSCEYSFANLLAWRGIYHTNFAEICDGFAFRIQYNGEYHG